MYLDIRKYKQTKYNKDNVEKNIEGIISQIELQGASKQTTSLQTKLKINVEKKQTTQQTNNDVEFRK